MATWPLNWNVVRHDLVVGSGPRTPSDLDALRVETRLSAVLSVQHDECLAEHKIDYPRQVRVWPPARLDNGRSGARR